LFGLLGAIENICGDRDWLFQIANDWGLI